MLQQTQVERVKRYFSEFTAIFPSLESLAKADEDQVLAAWSGLGYYSRARNLHKAAQKIVYELGCSFPRDFATLSSLPGIGKTTAHAILAQAFEQPYPILDANVIRIFGRYFAIEHEVENLRGKKIYWELAHQLMPQSHIADYTQALMDFGSLVCKKTPICHACPFQGDCQAFKLQATENYPRKKPKKRPEKLVLHFAIRIQDNKLTLQKHNLGIWQNMLLPPLLEKPLGKPILMLEHSLIHKKIQAYCYKFEDANPIFSISETTLWNGQDPIPAPSLVAKIYQALLGRGFVE